MFNRFHCNSRPSLPLRLVVMLLAFVQFVAPTWHVCSMGGHVMAMQPGSMTSGSMAPGTMAPGSMIHGDVPVWKVASSDPTKPLICYCAAKPKHDEDPKGPKLSATVSHDDHATCLALLLQTMPGAFSAPAVVPRLSAPVTFTWQAHRVSSPSYSPLPRFRGRAPPVSC